MEYSRALAQGLREVQRYQPFDLIEATETGAYGLDRLDRRLPLLIRLHGEQYTFHKYTPGLPLTVGIRLQRVVQRAAIRSARGLVSPSRAHAREVAGEFYPRPLPIATVPNCVELDSTWNPNGRVSSELRVLFVGRLEKRKGVPELLRAAAQVVRKFPEAKFILAGAYHPSLPQAELQTLVKDLNLESQVELVGHAQPETLRRLYQTATLCILPSYYETFGVAVAEAMAWGVPVIASDTSSLPEVIENGVSGTLVPPGDVGALASALDDLLSDAARRLMLGRNGRERVAELFTVEKVMSRNLELYNSYAGVHQ